MSESTSDPAQVPHAVSSDGDDESSVGSTFPPDAERLLQEEMMKLSLKDRNDYQEEVHGVQCLAKEETPEFLKDSLEQLDTELKDKEAPFEERKYYLMSQELFAHKNKPTFVNSDEFRLRFLRCELFDVPTAAIHMNKYLGMVYELFGEFALQRPIRITDFSKAEIRELRKGRYQFLPYRDRAGNRGRRILSVFPDEDWEDMSPATRTKIWCYLTYIAGEDIEAQKHGFVLLVWFDNAWKNVSKKPLVSAQSTRVLTLGVRASSLHLCTPDTPKYRFRRSIMIMRLGKEKSRVKIHVGKSMELMYTLQSFGIPVDYIPISFTGKVKDKYIKEWIRLRQRIEEERLATPEAEGYMIESPYLDDIVFRNGTSLLSHPGNIFLRSLITAKAMHQDSKNKNTKELVLEVIAEIRGRSPGSDGEGSNSRRFLNWNEKGCFWKEVPPENEEKEIHSKLSRIVRDTRKLVGSANQKTAQQEAQVASRPKASTARMAKPSPIAPLPFPRNPLPITDQQGHGTFMFVQSNVARSHKRQKISPDRDCFGFEVCDGVQWFCT